MRRALKGTLALFSLVWASGVAVAEPVTAEGFGETASSAITNAALNAVRDVAGSRITVNQELSTKTFAGVPDEIFIEKLLEVSRGTVSRLKVISVEQVGDIYQASIQIEIDPGKLEIEISRKAALQLQPGELAGGVAEARLRSDSAAQIQDAFADFTSLDSKVVSVKSVSLEKNEYMLDKLKRDGALTEGMVPLRIVVEVAASPTALSELESTLKASSDEVSLSIEDDGDFHCDVAYYDKFAVAILKPTEDEHISEGTVICGRLGGQHYRSNITGVPGTAFLLDSLIDTEAVFTDSVFNISLVQQDGSKKTYSVPWRSEAPVPFIISGVLAGLELEPPRGNQFFEGPFSPSALLIQNGLTREGWLILAKIALSFTIPVSADLAEATTSVEVSVSRP